MTRFHSRYDRWSGRMWAPYVSQAERKRQAAKKAEALRKKGHVCEPVTAHGMRMAKTFWGRAWGDNLERYSDYANRLPRGRTYLRNGSVIDLKLSGGRVEALVSGSSIYKVQVDIDQVAPKRWSAVCGECSGAVASLL
ncbi:MAG: hypothetical protein HY905_08970 [Deltaproteobacteria bacterium]|nr:hypothetical protein [Deltaproteobacteria bacterium]